MADLAGLAAVIKIAEMGGQVDLFSIVPVKRSHSVCAQGGINAAKNLKGEGDSTWQHFDDTVYGGDFLANQPPVKAMCERRQGSSTCSTAWVFPSTALPKACSTSGASEARSITALLCRRNHGQQLLYALDEQVRRYESEGKVRSTSTGSFFGRAGRRPVCRGICAMDLRTTEIRTFPADAIIIATGGIGAIFGKSTNPSYAPGQRSLRFISRVATTRTVNLLAIRNCQGIRT